jgi:hypothetical protein
MMMMMMMMMMMRRAEKGFRRVDVTLTEGDEPQDVEATLIERSCPSPLLMHSFCMQHQVMGCASLAAIDNTGEGPRSLSRCSKPGIGGDLIVLRRFRYTAFVCSTKSFGVHHSGYRQ